MKDFVEGIIKAVDKGIMSKKIAFAYINAFVYKEYDICFTDEMLKKLGRKIKSKT